MPANGRSRKDIAGKIVNFLRAHDGRAVIKYSDTASLGNCTGPAIGYSLQKLMKLGVIDCVDPPRSHNREYTLSQDFKSGDSWRELFNQGTDSSGG